MTVTMRLARSINFSSDTVQMKIMMQASPARCTNTSSFLGSL